MTRFEVPDYNAFEISLLLCWLGQSCSEIEADIIVSGPLTQACPLAHARYLGEHYVGEDWRSLWHKVWADLCWATPPERADAKYTWWLDPLSAALAAGKTVSPTDRLKLVRGAMTEISTLAVERGLEIKFLR